MNRYEYLFGAIYAKLVQQLTNKFSTNHPNDVISANVLLYKPYNDNCYYVGTHRNPLLMPDEVENNVFDINYPKHFSPRCLWDLASFICSNQFITMLDTVFFHENKKLVIDNVSTFALTYSNAKLEQLKQSWRKWAVDTRNTINWNNPPDDEDELANHLIVRQSFVLANILLIMMPTAITDDKGKRNNSARIVEVVMGRVESDPEYFDPETGFKVLQETVSWKYVKKQLVPQNFRGNFNAQRAYENARRPYEPLMDLIEFILIHPLPAAHKEGVLRVFLRKVENKETNVFLPRPYNISVLAHPLFYNGSFQGIVFVTKACEYENNPFTEDDATTLKDLINKLQIESRLADSLFDLAKISLSHPECTDAEAHPLLKTLRVISLFSSACSGIVLYKNEKGEFEAWERYRKNPGKNKKMVTIARSPEMARKMKKLLEANKFLVKQDARWLFKNSDLLRKLKKLPTNGEKYTAKSVMVLAVEVEENTFGYILLFFEEVEKIVNQFSFGDLNNEDDEETSRDGFAERAHNLIIKLIDADKEHRRLTTLQKQLYLQKFQDLSLMTPHRMVNSFQPRVITPLKTALEYIREDEPIREIQFAINYLDRFTERAREFSRAWSHYIQYRNDLSGKFGAVTDDKLVVTIEDFIEIHKRLREGHGSELDDISHDINIPNNKILISRPILEYLLDSLVANAVEVYEDEYKTTGERKERKVVISLHERKSNNFGINNYKNSVIVSVWNSDTEIPTSFLNNAGIAPLPGVQEKRTGLGFYFLETALSNLQAERLEDKRHFKLENTSPDKGVKVSFGLHIKGEG